jgi:hypothetical protein
MITSVTELAAVHAVMAEDLRAVCARKIARLAGLRLTTAPTPLPAAPLREFVAIVTPRDGQAYERTTWATCSMEVLVGEVERLARMGVAGARIEVRPL